ncbi:MAG: DUF6359 domain-containing protein [Paludibacter sp.]
MTKTKLLSFIYISLQFSLFAGTGTQVSPFTVSQAIAKSDGSAQTYWVKGYIVGEMNDFSNNKYFYELAPPFDGTTSYLIADNPDEINLSKCMPIQLSGIGSDTLSLDAYPQYWRKEILTCGLLRDYFSMPGFKTLSSLEILTPKPLIDEVTSWNFFENMDGTYSAASTSSIFAGGTYTGETGVWELYGATWGDSGNDNKWGKASARLRLSEASTGTPGYIQMNFDKPNGVGEVRFWAGYYDTDSGGALSIQTSKNAGQSWETVITSQFIAKDWKEYQFAVNQSGNVRVRIIKAETGSAGINIDKIKLSDFSGTSEIPSVFSTEFKYFSSLEQIHFTINNPVEKLQLYSISGREVWRMTQSSGSFDIKVPKGVYILKINEKSYKVICR